MQVARSTKRPFTLDYIQLAFTDFIELHGDRAFREDAAIVGGWARLDGETVMVIGHQRGRDTKEILKRNFGMPHPEGYRKALRLMKLAEKFHVPVITFIDTLGAWAGLGAEERGQTEAIARNLFEMSRLEVPIIATVIGEGGSGGALALGVADRTNMLENAVYSVITVEGCAAILWKDGKSQEMREKAASRAPHHGAGSPRAARDRRDHPGAAGRRARESRADRRSRARDARAPARGSAPVQAGQARSATAREVSANGTVLGMTLDSLTAGQLDGRTVEFPSSLSSCLAVQPSSRQAMSHLIEVAFKGNRKEFFLWEADEPPPLKAAVIVDADRGEDLGRVHAIGELAREAQRRRAARLRRRRHARRRRGGSRRRDDVQRAERAARAGRGRAPPRHGAREGEQAGR